MSLNFTFAGTEYLAQLEAEGKTLWLETEHRDGGGGSYLRPEADYVVWASALVGIGTITTKNVETFVDRCLVYEKLHGPIVKRHNGSEWVSAFDADVIRRCVGFGSNVSPRTKADFTKMLLADYAI